MELSYKGANCIQINTKTGSLVTDPNLTTLGLKDVPTAKTDIYLLTQEEFRPANSGESFVISTPGEYEVKGFSIQGLAARSHMDAEDKHSATIYRINIGLLNILVTGHIYPELSDKQLEQLGIIDVMVVPVGGNGYTLDATGASKLVRRVDPKIVIPTHFADPSINYPVPQRELEEFVKELGAPYGTVDKLKLKTDALLDGLSVTEIKRL